MQGGVTVRLRRGETRQVKYTQQRAQGELQARPGKCGVVGWSVIVHEVNVQCMYRAEMDDNVATWG